MLKEKAGPAVPLYGSHGFPYRCGVTPADFAMWAISPMQETYRDQSIQATTIGGVLASFCDDCAIRSLAMKAGTCIKPVLESYVASANQKHDPRADLAIAQATERLHAARG